MKFANFLFYFPSSFLQLTYYWQQSDYKSQMQSDIVKSLSVLFLIPEKPMLILDNY